MLDWLRQGLSLAHRVRKSPRPRRDGRHHRQQGGGQHQWARLCWVGCPDEGTFDGQARYLRGLASRQLSATKRPLEQ